MFDPLDEFGPVHVVVQSPLRKRNLLEVLRADAESGLTATESAAKRRYSYAYVCAMAKRGGFSFRRLIKTAGPEHYLSCAARGLTKIETAREIGVSHQAVCQIAARYNIQFKKFEAAPPPKAHKLADNKAAWLACASANMTPLEAATAMGKSRGAAYEAARRYGIKFASEWTKRKSEARQRPAVSNSTTENQSLHAQTIGHGEHQCPGEIPSKTFGGAA